MIAALHPATVDDFVRSHRDQGDAELTNLAAEGDRLSLDEQAYVRGLLDLAERRIQDRTDCGLLARLLEDLDGRRRKGELSAYGCAEAMQVCAGDIAQLHQLRLAGVPTEVIDDLGTDLLEKALDVVARIFRNLRIRLASTSAPTAHAAVRPLSRVMAEDHEPPDLTADRDSPVLVIATAGRGTRLRTTIPKGLVVVGGEPMITRTTRAAAAAGIDQFVFVVRYQASAHVKYLSEQGRLLVQERAEGTAHSTVFALAALRRQRAPVLLSFSDMPFLSPGCFSGPLDELVRTGADFVFSSFPTAPDDAVGQIVRDPQGNVSSVGQARMGAARTGEGDGGVYAMRPEPAYRALLDVRNDNVRREYGLPDITQALGDRPGSARARLGHRGDFVSVNTPAELILAELRARTGTDDPLPGSPAQHRAALDYLVPFGGIAPTGLTDEALVDVLDSQMSRIRALTGPVLDLSDGSSRSRWA